jgi:hypothetical protein
LQAYLVRQAGLQTEAAAARQMSELSYPWNSKRRGGRAGFKRSNGGVTRNATLDRRINTPILRVDEKAA